jgi:hypothetical protein
MNRNQIDGALAALPRFDSDPRRSERTRGVCRSRLQDRSEAEHAGRMIATNVLEPLAMLGSLAFLMVVVGRAIQIVVLSLR